MDDNKEKRFLRWISVAMTVCLLSVMSVSCIVSMRGNVGESVMVGSAGNGTSDRDSTIGLSRHVRHLRFTPDTAVVTVDCCGWIADSVRIREQRYYTKKRFDRTFRLSEAFVKAFETDTVFEKTCGWLSLKFGRKRIVFIAPSTFGECDEHRDAVLYLHKGNIKDSVKILQGGQMAGWERGIVDPLDVWPFMLKASANGGKTEATTKTTEWWIEKIVFYRSEYGLEKEECIFSDSDKEKRLRTQRCDTTVRYVTIKGERKDIDISVSPNKTGRRRRFMIVFRCDNSCSYFNGEQAAE